MTSPTELATRLRRRAAEAGFAALGIARAQALTRDGVRLEEWLGRGSHAEMSWLARAPERRSDPRELLPGCRSVVSLALNYGPGQLPAAEPGKGRVAAYAWGRDYHKVLGKQLKRLAAWLEETTGSSARTFVDTGPVLERAWAQRSGIGWIGKNANLISRKLGSWLLLGEILTCAELPPDAGPHLDHCGTCSACIDACPTDAIVAAGEVDSWRCISYWTIEHRGTIPPGMREGIGQWAFGCDVCQDVCPWNRTFGQPAQAEDLERRPELQVLEAAELLGLDESEFRARYSGTSLMRAKWEGMRRNACVVLGNQGDPAALGALERALDDPSPEIRAHAAWAIGRIGGNRGASALRRRQPIEDHETVQQELSRALASVAARHDTSPDRP